MNLSKSSARLLGLLLSCAILIPVNAAELEGTLVPVGESPQVNVEANIDPALPVDPAVPLDPASPLDPVAPAAPESDEQRWMQESEVRMRDAERQARDAERRVREQQGWQRELEKNLQQAFGGNHQQDNSEGTSAMDALIVIISVIAGVTFLCSPFILIGFYLSLRYRVRNRRQQDINNNIDKLLAAGRDIPVELLRGDEPRSASESGDLARGVRNLFLGIGLLIFLTVFLGFKLGSVGFIWIALGCSQIVIWYLNKPKAGSLEQQVGQQD